MNIYFAGVPAGNQAKREHHLVRVGMQNRLVTFYYERQAGITLDNFYVGRVVHCKKDRYDVYIGRKNEAFHFGNPFKIGRDGNRREVVNKFWTWLNSNEYPTIDPDRKKWILDNINTLKGKILGCWCEVIPCHGYVLLELAEK